MKASFRFCSFSGWWDGKAVVSKATERNKSVNLCIDHLDYKVSDHLQSPLILHNFTSTMSS